MNLTTIEDRFEGYDLPNLNWVRLPNIKIEDDEKIALGLSLKNTNIDFLKEKTFKGLELRELKGQIDKSKKQQYIDRINEEILLIDELGFCDYYLLVWRTIEYAKKLTSYLDPARGSCGGSAVFYMMGVTQLDPVKHELFLSRFISKARANKKVINGITYIQGDLAPDVDINFSKDVREKVIHWLEQEYGGKMAQIATYNSFTTKILLKECYKSLIDEGNEDDAKKISDCVQSKFGKLESIDTVYENNEYFKLFCDKNPEIIQVAKKLQNLPKATGSHASGFVISFDPLNKICQLSLNKESQLACVYEMNDISKLSLKLDLLGLTTNKIVDDCLKTIGKIYDDINLDEDPEIYRHFQSPYLGTGIYQIEKGCAYNVTRAVKPKNVGELSDVNALARPGALSYLSDYVNNTGECPHEIFRPILAKTRYQPLYQEQMIQMAMAIGFTPEEGEIIRRCVTGDTKFFSKRRGWITINKLIETNSFSNDLFLIIDENGKEYWKPIKDIWSNGIKQIRYVETTNGNFIKATMHHQFLTDTGWKSRIRLSKNDYIASTFNTPYFGNSDDISRNMSIILAGIMTEGYFVKNATPTFTNYDKDIYNKFYLACCFEFGRENITQRPCGKVIALKKNAYNKLIDIMPTGKSEYKDVPEIIFSQNKRILQDFISFSFACEGTITEKELSITSKSRKLIQSIQLLLYQFNIRTTHNIDEHKKYGKYSKLRVSDSQKGVYLKRFIENFSHLLQNYKIIKLNKYYENQKNNYITNDDEKVPASIVSRFMNQYPHIPHKMNMASGRLYNGGEKTNISNMVFNKLCKKSKNKKWIDFCHSNVVYSKIKSLEQDIREVEVFDFTIDDETPFIVANGMIIHNCVAKKKKDQVAEWEPKVRQKCIDNGHGVEVAEYFWKLLKESADYSFNLSHSLGVSYVGALTTYLKYNHPKEFYTSFLNNCKEFPDFVEKTSSAIRELKHFGIKILAPDLLKSKDDFTVENDGIRYGLRYIKGVSDNSLSQLAEFKQKYENKFDVFKAIDDLKIKLNVICPLIQAGALEHENQYGRTYCVFEAQIWKNLTVKEKNIMMEIGKDFNYDLPLCLRHLIETGKIKPSRANTLRKNTERYKEIYNNNKKYTDIVNWFYEYRLLGFSYSYELVDVFKDFEKSKGRPELFNFVSLDELVSNHLDYQDQTIRIVGIVTEKVIKESQKTGNKYLRCTIEDGKNRFDVFLMDKKGQIDDMIIEQGKTPEKEDLICCQGKLSKTDDEDKIPVLFADSIRIQKDVNVFMKLHDLNTYKKSKS